MEKRLDDYPERIEKYLKPLPLSERMDIVKEIKSDMLDLQRDGKTVDEIIERLGSPKELAKALSGKFDCQKPILFVGTGFSLFALSTVWWAFPACFWFHVSQFWLPPYFFAV